MRTIEGRTNTIARTFDRVCDLLVELDYLRREADGLVVTSAGQRLRSIYTEKDLLVAECLRAGIWRGLDPAGMAAVASAIVFEARRDETGIGPRTPGGATRRALDDTVQAWSRLQDREAAHRLELTGPPDLGLTWPIHRWALGRRLEQVLEDGDLTPGDFVRWTRQVVDLLGQLGQAAQGGHGTPADAAVAAVARDAIAVIDRGVVATAGVDRSSPRRRRQSAVGGRLTLAVSSDVQARPAWQDCGAARPRRRARLRAAAGAGRVADDPVGPLVHEPA